MRNLKKILALVLALVMSLSLMATAGAAETTAADGADPYAAAEDVLTGLGVYKGDAESGDFRFDSSINRAETAALVYRIATADVNDVQSDIYTNNPFQDVLNVPAASWANGYISYGYNAEIIKGTSTTTFEPLENVTGHQILAMVLRTLGYGKNGEFTGDGWEIQTAAYAQTEGLLNGVTAADQARLGQPATRGLVAQIIFNALMQKTVKYSSLIAGGYVKDNDTLGKQRFSLERITGVVVANEFADLRDDNVEAAGKTVLAVGESEYTLNVTTTLDDIGESRYAYVQPDGKHSYTLVTKELYDTGSNIVAETGKKQSSVSSFAKKEADLSLKDAEYFINFGEDELYNRSEYRISYLLSSITRWTSNGSLTQTDFVASLEEDYGIDVDTAKDTITGPTLRDDGNYYFTWTIKKGEEARARISIAPGEEITAWDRSCIQDIFYYAGLEKPDAVDEYGDVVLGEVYVGTQYTKDISDTMSYREFVDTYLKTASDDQYFTSSVNGDWLKVVDNDNDGVADYVFKTWYVLDEINGYNTRHDYYTYNWVDVGLDGYDAMYLDGYEPAVGDVVLYAIIDGTAQIQLAPTQVATVKTVSYKDVTITTTGDETYDQSAIYNETEYADEIVLMDEKVEYELFFDRFENVRAYRLVEGSNTYGLLTELYFTNQQNTQYIRNTTPIVELKAGDADIDEFEVSNYNYKNLAAGAGPFVGMGRTNTVNGYALYNWLQRAINHLGTTYADPQTTVPDDGSEFDWTAAGSEVSETNVAKYVMNDDGTVSIVPAAAFAYNKANEQLYYSDLRWNGGSAVTTTGTATKVTADEYYTLFYNWKGYTNPNAAQQAEAKAAFEALKPVYAVDYVKLAITDIAKGASAYDIDAADASYNDRGNTNLEANYRGNYVNAVHDTEYYLVMDDEIVHFSDYTNLPAIDDEDINAIYAVAENTKSDSNSRDYWVANVIVIELTGWDAGYDSISLAYYNPSKTTADTKHLYTLNNESEDPDLEVIASSLAWKNQWVSFGFYALYDTAERDESSITAADIDLIDENFNKHGIYAGVVRREAKVEDRGEYIMVNRTNNKTADEKVNVKDVPVYAVINGSAGVYSALELNTKTIEPGHEIIWVNDSDGNVAYVVIANYVNVRTTSAAWIGPLYASIVAEQELDAGKPSGNFTVTFKYYEGTTPIETIADKTVSMIPNQSLNIVPADFAIANSGYTISTVNIVDAAGVESTTDSGTTFTIPAADAIRNITVNVHCTKVNCTLTTSGTLTTTPSGGTYTYAIGNAAAVAGPASSVATNYNDPYTIAIDPNPLYTYDATVTGATKESCGLNPETGKWEITGKITGVATVAIQENIKLTTVIHETHDAGVTAFDFDTLDKSGGTLADGGEVVRGTAVEFTLTLGTDISVDAVIYRVGADAAQPAEHVSGNTYKVPGLADTESRDIYIAVTTKNTGDHTADFTGTPTANVLMKSANAKTPVTIWTATASTDFVYGVSGTIELQAQDGKIEVNAPGATVTNPSGDFQNWIVSGITADTTITISDPDAATGLTVTVTAAGGGVDITDPATGNKQMYAIVSATAVAAIKKGMTQAEVEALTELGGESLVNVPENFALEAGTATDVLVVVELNSAGLVVKAGEAVRGTITG